MIKDLIKEEVLIEGTARPFLSDSSYLRGVSSLPLVIFCHGYKGFKDWGAWDKAMDYIAETGCYAVKFNFSLNGTTIDNPQEFDDLEAFGQNTYSQEQRDLTSVIDYYKEKPEVDKENIYLIGHSRGGGTVILQGYYNADVKGIITWAGVSDYRKRFPKGDRFEEWKAKGVFYSENGRTKQQMPHYFTFWEDYEENETILNVQKAAQNLKKPTLIVQGTNDPAVPLKEAQLLHQWISNSLLDVVDEADHVFGSRHPYTEETLPNHLEHVAKVTSQFIHSTK
ncbi:alpha/beta hydrolase family protein [Myroides odoratimimus]|uniref:alpha/beta hydrolase family protein n=1 Tax=Myroides odoratimimus TaxID=76832 RepID=UPI0025749C1F|nr:alpha/beta fold hydrolase [Myroides odoratimimus]MDM1520576.1 alpha/beta fold hydrolase [Myroides odoratimimus]